MLFYHLERQRLEEALPKLLEKTLERGWRAVVETRSSERLAALDTFLWTYADESFLPHAPVGDGDEALQPILLTDRASAEPTAQNGAQVRFYVDGAVPADLTGLERAVLLFEGRDPEAVAAAREVWRRLKGEGHALTYWQQDGSGRWVKKAGA